MEKKVESLSRARYYVNLCESHYSSELLFALRMYCIVNGFMKSDNSSTCLLLDVVQDVMKEDIDNANLKLAKGWVDEQH